MSSPSTNREALERLQETASRYREAFLEVQRILATSDLGRIPSWTFAIDRLALEEVAELSEELAAAEKRRRAWRTALHSLTELIALDEAPESDLSATTPLDGSGDAAHMGKLDRFITIVNAAKAGGCIYLDGRFEPVRPGQSAPPAPRPASSQADDVEGVQVTEAD